MVERFDRAHGLRVHQEDFNQALGATGNRKYQEIGGVVSLRRVADTLLQVRDHQRHRQARSNDDTRRGGGNLDMHTKNLGLLHPASGDVTLAPAYDVVPMAHHRIQTGRWRWQSTRSTDSEVTQDDLIAEMQTRGRRPEQLVQTTLEQLFETAEVSTRSGAHPPLRDDVLRFTRNLIEGRAVGGE